MPGKVLEVEFRAKDAMSATLKQAGLNADQLARKMREIDKGGSGGKSGGKGLLGSIDSGAKDAAKELGSSRALKKLLKGGLVGFAGHELADATAKMVELNRQFREGKVSAAGMFQGILEGLPIIGGFATAGKNIRELFTHEQEDIDKINEKSRVQNQLTEYRLSLLEREKKAQKEYATALTELGSRKANAGLEGYGLERNQRSQAGTKRLADLDAKRDAEIEAIQANAKKQRETIHDPAAASKITKEAEKAVASVRSKYADLATKEKEDTAAEDFAWQRKQFEQGEKLVDQHEREVTSIQHKAYQDRLKSLGMAGAAELDQITTDAENKKKAIREQFEEQKKTTATALLPGLIGVTNRQLRAVDAEAAGARGNLAYQHQQSFMSQQDQQRQQVLDARAELASTPGSRIAARTAAEKNRLKDEMKDRAKALAEVLNDPTLTDAQKRSAQVQAAQWAGTAQQQMQRNIVGERPHVDHLFDLSESRTLTGEGAAAREKQEDPVAKTAANTEEIAKGQADFQKTLAQVLQQLMIANGSSPQQVQGLFP